MAGGSREIWNTAKKSGEREHLKKGFGVRKHTRDRHTEEDPLQSRVGLRRPKPSLSLRAGFLKSSRVFLS